MWLGIPDPGRLRNTLGSFPREAKNPTVNGPKGIADANTRESRTLNTEH